MTRYEVTFERIGRGCKGTVEEFEATDLQHLSEVVYEYARRHLASRGYEVTIYQDKGDVVRGSIEMGRFGRFTVKELAEAGG